MGADGAQMLMGQRLVAIVPTFNRFSQARETIERLLTEPCLAVVVVDNGSNDGTREWLSAQTDPRLKVIFAPSNLGGAGGFELGIKVALEEYNPDWVVVMDDDARPYPGAFADFARVAQDNWDMLAAAVYYPDGHICEMNRPSRNPFWHGAEFVKTVFNTLIGRGRKGFHVSDAAYGAQITLPIDVASFVGMFISRRVIEAIGTPNGKLFIYSDDVLYSLQAGRAGFNMGFAPQIRFEHACSTYAEKKIYAPYWKVYYNYRNTLIAYREAAGWWFPIAVPVFLTSWVLRGRYAGENKGLYYHLLWLAVKHGFATRLDLKHADLLALIERIKGR